MCMYKNNATRTKNWKMFDVENIKRSSSSSSIMYVLYHRMIPSAACYPSLVNYYFAFCHIFQHESSSSSARAPQEIKNGAETRL